MALRLMSRRAETNVGALCSVALNVAFFATGAKVLPAVKWQSAVDI